MFHDTLLLKQGLEYAVKLPSGHVVSYLSKETAEAYREAKGGKVIAPKQGPERPVAISEIVKSKVHSIDAASYGMGLRDAGLSERVCKSVLKFFD